MLAVQTVVGVELLPRRNSPSPPIDMHRTRRSNPRHKQKEYIAVLYHHPSSFKSFK